LAPTSGPNLLVWRKSTKGSLELLTAFSERIAFLYVAEPHLTSGGSGNKFNYVLDFRW
jgi:hypothetical protein